MWNQRRVAVRILSNEWLDPKADRSRNSTLIRASFGDTDIRRPRPLRDGRRKQRRATVVRAPAGYNVYRKGRLYARLSPLAKKKSVSAMYEWYITPAHKVPAQFSAKSPDSVVR